MSSRGDVEARDVATRLLDSLAPLVGGAIEKFQPEDAGVFASKLVILLQPAPSRLIRLVLEAGPGGSACELVRGRIATMPNAAAIEKAVEDLLAGILAGMGEDLAERTVEYASLAQAGGLVVEVTPLTGVVRVLLCPEGKTLDQGTVLGGIVPDRPETRH